jgi:uncharacterized protein
MRIAAAALLLAAIPFASAGQHVQASTPVEIARIVLPRSNWEQILAVTSAQMDQSMEQALRQDGNEVTPELASIVRGQARDMMNGMMPSYEEMLDVQAGLLAKHYSAAELKQLLAFYRSPLGQKTIRITPEVMKDVMGWMQSIMQQRMPPAMAKLQTTVKAYLEQRAKEQQGGDAAR